MAQMMNIVTTGLRFKAVKHGLGRHFADPSVSKPHDINTFSYYSWLGQVINLFAVAVLKFSICAYLLALKFSRVYTSIVWTSILLVAVFCFIVPALSLFNCTPFETNWIKAPGTKTHCFMKGRQATAYTQVRCPLLMVELY
jgi:hypothetical protein